MRKLSKSLNRVLSIQNFGSSGSKLVHALLDNHPNILTIPSLYMINFYAFWPEDIDRDRTKVINDFVQKHSYWFDPRGYAPWGTHTMGPNRDESIYVEKEVFLKHLHEIISKDKTVSRKFFFQAVYVAYALSYGRSLQKSGDQYILVYPHHTSNQNEAVALSKDFPSIYFLHCFREPIQTLGSTYKIGSLRWGGFPPTPSAHTTALVELSIFLADRYIANKVPYKIHAFSPILPEYEAFSKAIRLEDIVQNPKAQLTALCEWLNIPWDDALMAASYNGKIWWNRPESESVTGFSKKPLSQSHNDVFNRFDRFRLEVLMAPLKSEMGYPTLSQKISPIQRALFSVSLFLPFKMELLSTLPSKFSLPKSFELPKIVNTAIQKRLLHGTGIKSIPREIYRFSYGWFSLAPLKAYINIRKVLLQALKNYPEKQKVVEIL